MLRRLRGQSGFSNQQALLVLLICFPVGLIGVGVLVVLLQRPSPTVVQAPQSEAKPERRDQSTTIQPLPRSSQTFVQPTGLSEQEARSVVEQWLTVKSQIFAPPFNTDLADQVVASGPLWRDLTKENGSINWLKKEDSYYTYDVIRVNRVLRYLPSETMPSIVVSVTENSVLHSPNGNEKSSNTNNWMYTLQEENGRWKIWDYRKQ
tara:strand:- start:2582 stop:3199 length:618 start_codon:yes stop_codon:yes gene_type:complete